MTGFLIVIHTIVSLLLIAVVLMQASQGGGLSGTFGGNATSSVLGGQNAGNILSRITTWLATLFLTLAVIISVLSGPSDTESTSLVKQAAENSPDIPAAEIIPTEEQGTLDLDGNTSLCPGWCFESSKWLRMSHRRGGC